MADLNDPIVATPKDGGGSSEVTFDALSISQLMEMGFTREITILGLKNTVTAVLILLSYFITFCSSDAIAIALPL